MRIFDLISLIFDNLNRRKGRVALTAVGVVIGTAAVVLLVSLASGLQKSATDSFGNIGDLTSIFVMPGYIEMQGGGGSGGGMVIGGPGGQEVQLTSDAIAKIKALPGVAQVIPRDDLRAGSSIRMGRMETYANLVGLETDNLEVMGYTLKEGTLNLERGTAILGGWAANNFQDPFLRPGQEPPAQPDLLDQQVKIVVSKYSNDGQEVKKTVTLRIVGILTESRSESDNMLIMRMDELTALNEWVMGQRISRNRVGYNQLIVKAADTKQVLDLSQQINDLGYMAYTPQSYVQGVNSVFTIMQIIFGGVGAVALLVAAIGIANTMTMAILERTREIGLMKAVGASNRDVLSIFLGEAAGIGFLGGLGGVIFGWVGGKLLNLIAISYLTSQASQSGGMPPSIAVYTPAWLPIFALIFATLIGLLSGLYPALRAATLMPVTALKYE